jgi:hypothetical protein
MDVEGHAVGQSLVEVDERCNGPLHDGERVIDSRYDQGAWETLSIGPHGITMVGCAPEPMSESPDVQGGAFIMIRGERGELYTIIGGGA